jgi:predicted ArsR family transcriptional regulator
MTMLNRLLELLRAGGTYRVEDLARRLDTTPALVEVMLEDLGRMGYLKRANAACASQCTSCSMSGLCSVNAGGGQVWTLTKKGDGQ